MIGDFSLFGVGWFGISLGLYVLCVHINRDLCLVM
nr:MAG TPA: hypothetical protein [Caudoviricetes sp.]